MVKLRGFVGVLGLLALAVSMAISEQHAVAQRGEPSIQVLEERARDNRERIVALEATGSTVTTRLTRIETELEIARRVSESNGQLMTGLLVGMILILVERAFVLFGYLAKRARVENEDHA